MEGVFAPFHFQPAPGGPKHPTEMELSGLERAGADVAGKGTAPPIHYLTGLRPSEAEQGVMVFTMPRSSWLMSSRGEIATTASAFLADAALGGAVMTTMPPLTAIPTIELSLVFVEGRVAAGKELTARGTFVAANQVTARSRVEVRSEGTVLAFGSTTVMIEPTLVPLREATEQQQGIAPYRRPVLGGPVAAETWNERTGLEVLTDQASGLLPSPPIAWLLGLHLDRASEGAVSASAIVSGWMASPAGTVYGGFVAAALEWGLCCAAQTMAPAGGRERMLDLKVNYLRPLVPQGQVLGLEARLTHRGRRIVVGEAALRREDGKVIAQGVGTARLEQPR